jgi:TRAP-type C4-dicarboxylate transport system substrate-binding protein
VALALTAATADAQEVKLKLSHFLPASHPIHQQAVLPWIEEVRRRTGGRVEITAFPGATLCPPAKQHECARDGLADIAWAVTAWTPGRFPLTSVIELPFMVRTAADGSQMLAELWDRFLRREYEDTHLLFLSVQPPWHVHTDGPSVRSLEDLKDLRIGALTAPAGEAVELMGARRVPMPPTAPYEIHEAMSRRILDGFVMPFEALPSLRLHEVAHQHTEVGITTVAFAVHMNRKRYEALPADVRRVLDETTSPARGHWRRVGEVWDSAETAARRVIAERKGEVLVLGRDERRRWRDALRPLSERWAADLEKRGLPGRALLREARHLAARYLDPD